MMYLKTQPVSISYDNCVLSMLYPHCSSTFVSEAVGDGLELQILTTLCPQPALCPSPVSTTPQLHHSYSVHQGPDPTQKNKLSLPLDTRRAAKRGRLCTDHPTQNDYCVFKGDCCSFVHDGRGYC